MSCGCNLAVILICTVGSVCSSAALGASGEWSFAGARQDYSTSGAVAVGDFNGDSFPDIVVSGSNAKLTIRLNNGTGVFTDSATVPGGAASYITTGDFNNDGLLDAAYVYGSNVGIALGAGNGTFRNVSEFNVGYGYDLQAADFNGDGKLDVAVKNSGGVYIVLGRGDGTFLSSANYSGSYGYTLAVGDFDRDGRPDVLTMASGALAFYRNQGGGVLAAPRLTTYPGGCTPSAVAAADLDRNGILDAAAVCSSPGSVAIFRGDGTGGFQLISSETLKLGSTYVALADVNQDSIPDLLFNQVPTGSVKPKSNLIVRLGQGNGVFGQGAGYATAGADRRLLLANFMGAGKLDLLASTYNGYSILPATALGRFYDSLYQSFEGVLQQTVSADFNHDGIKDLAVAIRYSAGAASRASSGFSGAYILLGSGNPAAPFQQGQRLYIPPDVLDLKTADFNQDGNLDLAFITGSEIVIALGDGLGQFSTNPARYASSGASLAVADFNSDGKLDIVTSGVYLHFGNGDGTFGAAQFLIPAGGRFVAAVDLNNDGKPDLVAAFSGGSNDFYTALGNGDGTFSTPRLNGTSAGMTGAVFADFNHDGLLDMAEVKGYLYIYLNTGSGNLKQDDYYSIPSGASVRNVAAADFNRDGNIDLVVGTALGVQIYSGSGDGGFSTIPVTGTALYPGNLVVDNFLDFGQVVKPDIVAVGHNGAVSTLFKQ